MGLVSPQVGLHEAAENQGRVVARHADLLQYLAAEGGQSLGLHADVVHVSSPFLFDTFRYTL